MTLRTGYFTGLAIATLTLAAACERGADESATAHRNSAPPPEQQAVATTDAVALIPRSASPAGAELVFIEPQNGAQVRSPFPVEFGISGMAVLRAGEDVANAGHHHLLIDTGLPDLGLPIPADDNHVHFGDASTGTVLTLAPGEHTLQLLFADYLHIPHDPPVYSQKIVILVDE